MELHTAGGKGKSTRTATLPYKSGMLKAAMARGGPARFRKKITALKVPPPRTPPWSSPAPATTNTSPFFHLPPHLTHARISLSRTHISLSRTHAYLSLAGGISLQRRAGGAQGGRGRVAFVPAGPPERQGKADPRLGFQRAGQPAGAGAVVGAAATHEGGGHEGRDRTISPPIARPQIFNHGIFSLSFPCCLWWWCRRRRRQRRSWVVSRATAPD